MHLRLSYFSTRLKRALSSPFVQRRWGIFFESVGSTFCFGCVDLSGPLLRTHLVLPLVISGSTFSFSLSNILVNNKIVCGLVSKEICPQVGEVYAQVLGSARKRRRIEAKDTQEGHISSPAREKKINSNDLVVCQTSQRKSAAFDNLDSFSISSKLENTGLPKGDFQEENL